MSDLSPGFPVWDLAGLLGSTGWGLWVAALGVAIVLSPAPGPIPDVGDAADVSTPGTAGSGHELQERTP